MEPLEVLFEAGGLPAVELPSQLRELYGGTIGFHEPRLFANFVSTIDGVVAIPSIPQSNQLVSGDSVGDRFVMGLLRALADVVLIGAGTLASSPEGTWLPDRVYPPGAEAFAELRDALGKSAKPEVAILTGHGSIAPTHPVLESGALVLTSDPGAERLQNALPAASTILALGAETTIDPRRAVDALHQRGHRLILSEAGPHVYGSLAGAHLVDELFLTISPLLAGDRGHLSRYGLAEAVELMPPAKHERLLGVRRHGDHLFLRYELTGSGARAGT
jgi:riboflavin biosynthesis pyrimidine reductase